MPCKLGQSCQASNQCEEIKKKKKEKIQSSRIMPETPANVGNVCGGGGGCQGCNNYYSLNSDIHVTQRKRLCKIWPNSNETQKSVTSFIYKTGKNKIKMHIEKFLFQIHALCKRS